MNIILFEQWPEGNRIPIADYRAHHIQKILHLGPQDQFTMGLVNDQWGIDTITSLDQEGIRFSFEMLGLCEPLHPVTLLVAQVRPICMKRILREAVSFGIQYLMIVGSDTGERSYRSAKLWSTGEYRSYLLDGAMQSGQTGIPELQLIDSVDRALACDPGWHSKLLLDNVQQGRRLSEERSVVEPAVLAIGPERGWSERERNLFNMHGFSSYTMGTRILRTETACSAALALLLGKMGRI